MFLEKIKKNSIKFSIGILFERNLFFFNLNQLKIRADNRMRTVSKPYLEYKFLNKYST